jgi:hypothetical protein
MHVIHTTHDIDADSVLDVIGETSATVIRHGGQLWENEGGLGIAIRKKGADVVMPESGVEEGTELFVEHDTLALITDLEG